MELEKVTRTILTIKETAKYLGVYCQKFDSLGKCRNSKKKFLH